jgi:hypothetical protein
VYGVAISVIFAFLRWALPVMPKPVAWSGVVAGLLILLAAMFMLELNITLPAIGLFLVGKLCSGGAIYLSMGPKEGGGTSAASGVPATNKMGTVKNNRGIVTQGQKGDNAINSK